MWLYFFEALTSQTVKQLKSNEPLAKFRI